MTDLTRIKKQLEKFGLSAKQASLYILLLRNGSQRISEMVSATEQPRSSIYETLRGLFELGLAEEIIENNYKKIRAYPIGTLRHVLEEKVERLRKQEAQIQHLEKSLEILPDVPASPPTVVRYYRGVAGARQIFWNTLRSKNTVYVYSEWGRGRYLGIEFYKRFVDESRRRGFGEQVLTNPTERVLESIRLHSATPISRTQLDNIRAIERNKIAFKGETFMYDNIYASVFLKHEVITGFEIESAQFVKTQRAIFEALWTEAPAINNHFAK